MKNPSNTAFKSKTGPAWQNARVMFLVRLHARRMARYWFVLFLGTAIGGVGAALYAYRLPDVFQASSELDIRPKILNIYSAKPEYLEVLDSFYDNQLRIMQSAAVLTRVQTRMREPMANAGPRLVTTAVARRGRGTSFQIIVESTDLEIARLYARTWAREFITFKNEQRALDISQTAVATQEEAAQFEKKLHHVRWQIKEFLEKNRIGSAKETGDAAQQLLDQLLAEQTRIITQRQLLENASNEDLARGRLDPVSTLDSSRYDRNKEGFHDSDPDPLAKFRDTAYTELKLQRKDREARRAIWEKTLRPEHPAMRKLEADLADIDQKIQDQLELMEEKRTALIESYRKSESSYEPLIEKHRRSVIQSRSIQNEFERLKQEESFLQENLSHLRKTIQAFDLSTSDEGQFRILDEGVGQSVPVGPHRLKMILLGVVIGLGAGLGLIYFCFRMDDRLETSEEIEAGLQEPVIGQIPNVPQRGRVGRPQLVALDQPNSLFAESLRHVRSALMLPPASRETKVLVVSSAIPGDGKTTFTANFCAVLAEAGQRVLLLDGDMRRGNLHICFDHSRQNGLSDILEGKLPWHQVVKASALRHLQLITTGMLPSKPGDLLMGSALPTFLQEARQAYDWIIIDCPPVTALDDAFALANGADGLLFVVRAGQTPISVARNALAALHQRELPVIGLIVNGLLPDNPSYYYTEYYY
ncbi:MAG: polysaccharide biosynthesis tyrosine autokinase, partial [Verrucomicrobiota bacterium]